MGDTRRATRAPREHHARQRPHRAPSSNTGHRTVTRSSPKDYRGRRGRGKDEGRGRAQACDASAAAAVRRVFGNAIKEEVFDAQASIGPIVRQSQTAQDALTGSGECGSNPLRVPVSEEGTPQGTRRRPGAPQLRAAHPGVSGAELRTSWLSAGDQSLGARQGPRVGVGAGSPRPRPAQPRPGHPGPATPTRPAPPDAARRRRPGSPGPRPAHPHPAQPASPAQPRPARQPTPTRRGARGPGSRRTRWSSSS